MYLAKKVDADLLVPFHRSNLDNFWRHFFLLIFTTASSCQNKLKKKKESLKSTSSSHIHSTLTLTLVESIKLRLSENHLVVYKCESIFNTQLAAINSGKRSMRSNFELQNYARFLMRLHNFFFCCSPHNLIVFNWLSNYLSNMFSFRPMAAHSSWSHACGTTPLFYNFWRLYA